MPRPTSARSFEHARPILLASRRLTPEQHKAMRAIAACRTPEMGGHRYVCDRCAYERVQWNSCRNRACPRCQSVARRQWLEDRRSELLPVPYFHVVFTAGLTLIDIGVSRLHSRLGALCVLHTWGQTLTLHPHVHCVVPGGGFSIDHGRWCSVRKPSFFLPRKVLARRFRTRLCTALREAWSSGQLVLPASIAADSLAFHLLLIFVQPLAPRPSRFRYQPLHPFERPACATLPRPFRPRIALGVAPRRRYALIADRLKAHVARRRLRST